MAEVLVREGSRVEVGEVIVRLYDFDKAKELSTVSGELEKKLAELKQLEEGPRDEEIDQAQKLIDTKRVELENIRRNIQFQNQLEQTLTRTRTELRLAEIELRRTTDLFEQGLGPRVDMEKAQTTVEVHQSAVAEAAASLQILAEENDREEDLKTRELAQAESALALLRAGSRPEEIQQREAEVNMLEDRQRLLHEEVKKSEIRAGISGTVTTPFVEKILNRHLEAGDEVCRIVDMDRVRAEMFVPEKEMGDVEPGMPVYLKARSFPTREFEGNVDFIPSVAEMVENVGVVKIRTELANADANIMRVGFDPSTGTVVGDPMPVTEASLPVGSVEPSPDGKSLVFYRVGAQEDIFVTNADGTDLRRLTNDGYFDRYPRWSPDGTKIAFYSNRGGNYQIWTIRPDGTGLRQLTDDPVEPAHSAWSPDGSRVAYTDLVTGSFIMEVKDQSVQALPALTDGAEFFVAFSWSPDGNWLAGAGFDARRIPEETGVYVYSLESGQYVRLTTGGGHPRWVDDSRTLVYADRGRIYTVDRLTKEVREVLSLDGGDLLLPAPSTDKRTLYYIFEPPTVLKPEMTGVAKIHAGRRRIIDLMTRRIIRWVRTEFWDLSP